MNENDIINIIDKLERYGSEYSFRYDNGIKEEDVVEEIKKIDFQNKNLLDVQHENGFTLIMAIGQLCLSEENDKIREDVLIKLINFGVNLDLGDENGNDAFYYLFSARYNVDKKILECLHENGHDPQKILKMKNFPNEDSFENAVYTIIQIYEKKIKKITSAKNLMKEGFNLEEAKIIEYLR